MTEYILIDDCFNYAVYPYVYAFILADPCISNPCRNGGTCLSEPPGDYKCVCPLGVDGLLCQVEGQ